MINEKKIWYYANSHAGAAWGQDYEMALDDNDVFTVEIKKNQWESMKNEPDLWKLEEDIRTKKDPVLIPFEREDANKEMGGMIFSI